MLKRSSALPFLISGVLNDILSLLLQAKKLNINKLYIKHIQVNQAPKQRRRTFRAHGRVNPYLSSPSHIELILTEKPAKVEKEGAKKKPAAPHTRREAAKLRTIKKSFASRAAKTVKMIANKKKGFHKKPAASS